MQLAFAEQEKSFNILNRLKFIWELLTKKQPEFYLTPQTRVKFGENKIYFDGDFVLEANGSIHLSAKKHVIIDSGQDFELDRFGYRHSVWINSPKDHLGRPVKMEWDSIKEFDPKREE